MDEADQAGDHEERFLGYAIRNATRPLMLPTGVCLNCDEAIEPPAKRFCDEDCSADWHARRDSARRRGETT
jgi:hypothetical protein